METHQPGKHLTIVTAAFVTIRPDRTPDYYLTPLNDLIEDLLDSEINIVVFTEPETAHLIKPGTNVWIVTSTLDEMVKTVWPEEDWRNCYQFLLKEYNPSQCDKPHGKYPELIGIWLSKFYMLEYVEKNFDSEFVLWIDAGNRPHYEYREKIKKYQKTKLDANHFIECTSILKKDDWLALKKFNPIGDHHGINMKVVGIDTCFILIRRTRIHYLCEKISQFWGLMMSNRLIGTEENALSFYYGVCNNKAAIIGEKETSTGMRALVMIDWEAWLGFRQTKGEGENGEERAYPKPTLSFRDKNAIFVSLVGDPRLFEAGLPSIAAYARKHQLDLIVKRHQYYSRPGYFDSQRPIMEKLAIKDYLGIYDRILYLDADILINRDAPNIFSAHSDPESIVALNVAPFDPASLEIIPRLNDTLGQIKWKTYVDPMTGCPKAQYFNTGVMIFTKTQKRVLTHMHQNLGIWQDHLKKIRGGSQGWLNWIFNKMDVPVSTIDYKFNYILGVGKSEYAMTITDKWLENRFDAHFIHYSGGENFKLRIWGDMDDERIMYHKGL